MHIRPGKRPIAAALGCILLLTSALICPARAEGTESPRIVSRDPKDYVNLEVLALYGDGACQLYTYEDEAALAAGLDALEADPAVACVQPNYAYRSEGLSVSDAYAGKQWALYNDGSFTYEEEQQKTPVPPIGQPGWWMPPWFRDPFFPFAYPSAGRQIVQAAAGIDVNAEEAWALYDGGVRDVTIALIDTGVDLDHPDLQDIFWTNSGEIPGNGLDDDGNGYIDDVHGWNFYADSSSLYAGSEDAHGTHNAGIISAVRDNGIGVAGLVQSPHVKIMVLKVLGGQDGEGSTLSIIRAIQYAEANGADICNLSLGSDENDPGLYRVISCSNMLFVAAAGNDGSNIDVRPCYPASYTLPGILSVACLNCDGALHSCSNYGPSSVDLAAPGAWILSTEPSGEYAYMTGTSMAAPMVTAAAAMMLSCSASLTPQDVKPLLLNAARPLADLDGLCLTGGMLDLAGAAAAAMALRSESETGGSTAGEAAPSEASTLDILTPILPAAGTTDTSAVGGFTDVRADSAYADGVRWAAELGIAKGTTPTTFSPSQSCTTAQILTFLWRTLGSPASASPCPFEDVSADSPYYTALCWAGEMGLLAGEAASASDPCTRAAAVTYLWRSLGCPPFSLPLSFSDVDVEDPCAAAVAWAVEQGVTNGVTPTAFAPDRVCSRGQIVTFLYRAFAD